MMYDSLTALSVFVYSILGVCLIISLVKDARDEKRDKKRNNSKMQYGDNRDDYGRSAQGD